MLKRASADYGAFLLGAAAVALTALLAARAHLMLLLFLRSHGLLSTSEASMPGMLGAIIVSQSETVIAWLVVSVLLTGMLGVWLPAMRTSLTGILGIVGLSHVPLLLWSVGTGAVANVILSALAGESALAHLTRDQLQERVIVMSGTLLAAKSAAYLAAVGLCVIGIRRAEGVSVAVAMASVIAAGVGSWLVGYVL